MNKILKTELTHLFDKINSCAEKLSSLDLWDKDIMTKINSAETHLRNAMTELIEITEPNNQTTPIQ